MIQKNTYLPIFQQVSEDLREAIVSGRLASGEQLPPEPVLAAELGVGRQTLRRALKILSSQGLIRQRKGKGTFVAYEAKCARAKLRIAIMGIGSGRATADPHRSELFAGIEDGLCSRNDVELLVMPEERASLDGFQANHLHGILFSPGLTEARQPGMAAIAGVPHVALCTSSLPLKRKGLVLADTENVRVSCEATCHLLDLGHRNIMHLTGDLDRSNMRDRLKGYRQALRQHGCGIDRELVLELKCLTTIEIRSRIREFLAGHPACTAVYAGGVRLTLAVLRVASDMGLRVPADLSIVGFDDAEVLKDLAPPLTLVRQPTGALGRKAAQMLMAQIDGEQLACKHVILDSNFVVGTSTAQPGKERI